MVRHSNKFAVVNDALKISSLGVIASCPLLSSPLEVVDEPVEKLLAQRWKRRGGGGQRVRAGRITRRAVCTRCATEFLGLVKSATINNRALP